MHTIAQMEVMKLPIDQEAVWLRWIETAHIHVSVDVLSFAKLTLDLGDNGGIDDPCGDGCIELRCAMNSPRATSDPSFLHGVVRIEQIR